MKAKFWGVRGSTPAPGRETTRCGGNTSCVELRLAAGDLVILDAGTGIRKLGQRLIAGKDPVRATLFFSHFHWDHIQGLPFFRPAFNKESELTVIGGPTDNNSIRDILSGQMASVYFPVNFGYMNAEFHFKPVSEKETEIGGARVRFIEANHTSRCISARFEEDGQAFVYMTDNELEKDSPTSFDRFVEFCAGADALIHDAQYTPETYGIHEGWGHSSTEDVVRLAKEAGVKNLYLYHHDPDSTDDRIDKILLEARKYAGEKGPKVFAAREGLEV